MCASERATATVLPLGIGASCRSADVDGKAFFADLPPQLPPPTAGSEEILNRTIVHCEVEPGTKSLMRRWLGDKCDIDVTRFSEAAFLFGSVARGTAITEQELERILPNVADVIQLITEPGFPTEQLRQRSKNA
jgi:hypothetical protein